METGFIFAGVMTALNALVAFVIWKIVKKRKEVSDGC